MKSQQSVNMVQGFQHDPLRIAQYSWVGLMLMAGLIADALGAPRWMLITGVTASVFPAILGLWILRDHGRGLGIAQAGLVLAWTCFAAVAVLATGAAFSPLTVFFVLGPVTAFAIGNDRLAIESSVFSVFAFLVALFLSGMGWVGAPANNITPIVLAGALAGILQLPVIVWAAVASRSGRRAAQEIKSLDRVAVSERALEKEHMHRLTAEKNLDERMQFFAGVGHDLKTPLNAINGFSEMMVAEIRGPLSDEYKDYAGLINESGQDLMLLVEDILDLAKAEANRHMLDMEPVDLGASGKSVMAQMQAQATRANVKLKMRTYGKPWALADVRAVRQIWQNLVSNAVKYSDKDAVVSLSARVRNGKAIISVKDTGAGMDAEDLALIAEPFAQGANSKGRKGTGLGLAVVKRFADLHKGKVMIDTAPGKGTQVQVILPLADMDDLAPLN